jgi:hypothetical protein
MSGYVSAAAAIVGAAVSYQNGQNQKKAAADALSQQRNQANEQARQADEANNRANMKQADTSAILSAAQQAGKAGASGTMLTGPQGIDTAALSLGKNTLLGQ